VRLTGIDISVQPSIEGVGILLGDVVTAGLADRTWGVGEPRHDQARRGRIATVDMPKQSAVGGARVWATSPLGSLTNRTYEQTIVASRR
jgi:hypothetical protein